MSACYRASLPTTHPALTPLGFSNLLNFPPATGASVEHRVRNGTESLRGPPEAPPRYSSSDSERLPAARAGIPCATGSDPRPQRQFCAGVATIPGQNGNSAREWRRSQAKTAIPCGSGCQLDSRALNRAIQSRPPWFRVLLIHRALPRGRV